MKTVFNIIFCLVLVFFTFNLKAQNTIIKHYGVTKGLPSSECYWVTQDSKGYLWVATDAGVVKYDGYKFKTYSTSNGLPDNTVFKIHEDKYGKIWFSGYSGKFAYYKHQTDSIYEIPANDTLVKITKTLPTDFSFDKADTLYIAWQKKGYVKVFPPLYTKLSVYSYTTDGVYIKKLNNGNYLYGQNFLNGNSPAKLTSPLIFDTGGALVDTVITTITKTASAISLSEYNNFLYFSTTYSIYQLLQNIAIHKLTIDKIIITINADKHKRLWVNTYNNGAFLFDSNFNLIANFLKGYSVTSSIIDNTNGVWLTTLEDGLFYIPNIDFNFYNKESGFSAEKLHSVAFYNNVLYSVASNNTINEFSTNTKLINYYQEDKTNSIWNLKVIDSLAVTYGSRSYLSDLKFSNKKQIHVNGKNIRVKDVEDYDKNNLLVCEYGNLYIVNKHNANATVLCKNLPIIFSICKVNAKIYLGTKTGLYVYENNEILYLGDTHPLLKNRVNDLVFSNNQLIIATKGYGVLTFNGKTIINQFTENDGLSSNIIKHLALDKQQNIWVGTNRGISRLKKNKNTYRVNAVNLNEGLVSSEINELLIKDSLLYFATNKGLGEINIKKLFNDVADVPVYIETFIVNNSIQKLDSAIILNYNQNNLQFFYKGIDIKSEGDIKYKYKLEGLDTTWIYTKNIYVQYTTLPPGNYKFIVYALNSSNQVSIQHAQINFTIKTPFWKTWWFILIIISLILILIFLVYLKRIKNIKKQEEQKTHFNKLLADSELKALRSQMNPHFLFNAINSIQNYVLKNEALTAQKYLTKFARLIRSVLENSKHEQVLLSKEIEVLELYVELEVLRANFNFDYEIILEDSLNSEHFYIPPMIIQPYIENAILHGLSPLTDRKGKLTITFSQINGILNCIIEDNGIGREKALEIKTKKDLNRQSLGMKVTSERIEILNMQSKLFTKVKVTDKYNNNEALGTIIEINIELKKEQII